MVLGSGLVATGVRRPLPRATGVGFFCYHGLTMADLVRGALNDNTNPRVLFAWQSPNVGDTDVPRGGYYQPVTTMSFRILYPDGTEYIAATVVDTSDDDNLLDRVDEGGKGRIVIPPFTVETTEVVGLYSIEVTFVITPDDGPALPSKVQTYTFRVLDEAHTYVPNAYAQIQDMLDAGFPVGSPKPLGGYSFETAVSALKRASDYVELITSRFFEPRYLVHDHDGVGGATIQVRHAIVALTDVSFTFTTFTPADLPIQEGDLRVYNRHIRQGLMEPDDRQDPRVEFLRTPNYRFPRSQLLGEIDILSSYVGFTESQQNVKMRGVWGYTDPDASPFGKTPDLIREVTLRIAARYISPLWSQIGGAGGNQNAAGPITMEKTFDQQVKFADVAGGGSNNGAFVGQFTGDPEIDQLLVLFMNTPTLGSA